eukprot:GHVS01017330.1.p1 GENE.GHVS01017330.1~~GHVS01017330.1.p1  ORF type:complete len:327 (+),score=49.60 GHVS01017330.1:64-981(+)
MVPVYSHSSSTASSLLLLFGIYCISPLLHLPSDVHPLLSHVVLPLSSSPPSSSSLSWNSSCLSEQEQFFLPCLFSAIFPPSLLGICSASRRHSKRCLPVTSPYDVASWLPNPLLGASASRLQPSSNQPLPKSLVNMAGKSLQRHSKKTDPKGQAPAGGGNPSVRSPGMDGRSFLSTSSLPRSFTVGRDSSFRGRAPLSSTTMRRHLQYMIPGNRGRHSTFGTTHSDMYNFSNSARRYSGSNSVLDRDFQHLLHNHHPTYTASRLTGPQARLGPYMPPSTPGQKWPTVEVRKKPAVFDGESRSDFT